jgi:NRAMP (natural resistance-associated macrophage protein)-like metal ion transporter
MNKAFTKNPKRFTLSSAWKRVLIFLTIFGPATITAVADNDAGGVATYSIAGAKLGYPILFPLVIITILLGVTQEMGMRLTVITRRGLADLIRERYGVRTAVWMFFALLIANMGTIITELSAVKTTSAIFNLPPEPAVIAIVIISFVIVTRGNYRSTEKVMLVTILFYITYIISAVKAKPDWGMALSNLFYPHGVETTPQYLKDYLIIGMGVLGTTITPWGQFFISSFAFDKKIEKGKVAYSQLEAYWGAFLTDFFSFFMILATASTLFVHGVELKSGEQAALAIQPFAGELAGVLFGVGILAAGFMGLVIVSLCTAYALAEFFGLSGSLDDSFRKSKTFYYFYIIQLLVAMLVSFVPGISLFKLAIITQVLNAVMLPPVFYFLIKLTSDQSLMGTFTNRPFQKWFAIGCTVVIVAASMFMLGALFIKV